MTCPYSLSRPGGVQGQVLGLARELRKLGVDVRIVAPCDGPPPDPGDRVRRADRRVGLERFGRADRARARDRAAHRRGVRSDRARRRAPARAGGSRPSLTALIGFSGPMVGTFHASGELLHMWTPARAAFRRCNASRSASPCPRPRVETAQRELGWRRLRRAVERHRDRAVRKGDADAERATGGVVRRPPRAAEGTRRAARRVARHRRDAVLWVAATGPQTDELRRARRRERRVARQRDRRRAASRMRGATVFCAPSLGRRVVRRRAARGDGRATPIVASAIEGYQNVAAGPGSAARAARTTRRAAGALRRAARRRRPAGPPRRRRAERAEEFSMGRLARRYLELYEQALVLAS